MFDNREFENQSREGVLVKDGKIVNFQGVCV
jgi:hypothetical protein